MAYNPGSPESDVLQPGLIAYNNLSKSIKNNIIEFLRQRIHKAENYTNLVERLPSILNVKAQPSDNPRVALLICKNDTNVGSTNAASSSSTSKWPFFNNHFKKQKETKKTPEENIFQCVILVSGTMEVTGISHDATVAVQS